MQFNVPKNIQTVLDKLRTAGYRALPVGGCVRDLLRGMQPHDWDITTSATPEEMLELFKDFRLAPISSGGIKHGTVTVILDHEPVEVTTFRCDGEYSDGRRPDSVGFSRNLEDDLSRRDFTVNALCIDENGEVVDMFGISLDVHPRVVISHMYFARFKVIDHHIYIAIRCEDIATLVRHIIVAYKLLGCGVKEHYTHQARGFIL